jgi:hypothetical protein
MALSRHDDDDNGGDSSSMMMIVIVSPDHHPAPDQKESKENDKVRSEKVDVGTHPHFLFRYFSNEVIIGQPGRTIL